jgi:hypothetical protein
MGSGRTAGEPCGVGTKAHPDSPKESWTPARLVKAADSAVTCGAARLGGTYRKSREDYER